MAALVKHVSHQNGKTLAFTAASGGGDTCPCEPGTVLVVTNGGIVPTTVTAVTPGTEAGLAIADQTITIAAGASAVIGPFGSVFADPSDGLCHLSYSATAAVTVVCVHVPA